MVAYRVREEVFNKIMVGIRKFLYFILKLDIHKKYNKHQDNDGYMPVMSYSPKENKYRFNCYCFECPVNMKGLCASRFFTIPFEALHEFDGDNIIKNYCG